MTVWPCTPTPKRTITKPCTYLVGMWTKRAGYQITAHSHSQVIRRQQFVTAPLISIRAHITHKETHKDLLYLQRKPVSASIRQSKQDHNATKPESPKRDEGQAE